MPATGDGNTTRHCWAPVGMILAVDLPASILEIMVRHAARVAISSGDVVTVLGASHSCAGHFCRHACKLTHSGSVVVLPDLDVIELYANRGPAVLRQLRFIKVPDGRSVAVCAVGGPQTS